MKQYVAGVFTLRGQILHNGHLSCLDKLFELADFGMIFIGSTNSPITANNSFNYAQRKAVIEEIIETRFPNRTYKIFPLNDYIYDNYRWKDQITDQTSIFRSEDVCMIGGSKGEWYFNLFSEFDKFVPDFNDPSLHATTLRKEYFIDGIINLTKMPKITADYLAHIYDTEQYHYVRNEMLRIKELNDTYGKGPFTTVDNVCIWRNKILLVQRKNHPGKGLWAIAGGYLDATDESVMHGAYRELIEETQANITFEQYNSFVKDVKYFNNPSRSVVAHINTHAHYVVIPDEIEMVVEGADDAAVAEWKDMEFVENNPTLFYDDHRSIIEIFVGQFNI